VIFNDRLGDVAERFLKKGAKVYLEGQLQTRKWTDQSGQEKYTTEVVLQQYRGELTMLDGRGDSGGGSEGGYGGGSAGGDYGGDYGGGGAPSAPRGGAQQGGGAQGGGSFGGGGFGRGGDIDDEIPF
jgi:single-strand DNA-binding protein